ncbi:MAG TPA: O-antigen ligase family protein [Thermoanaerobaculia bacterium]
MASPNAAWYERGRDRVMLGVVIAGALLLPLVVNPRDSYDTFRLPKVLSFLAEGMVVAAVYFAAVVLGGRWVTSWRERWVWLPVGAFAVMALVTALSTKPSLSAAALVTGAATLAIFLATVSVARSRGWMLLGVPLIAAAANALLVMVEEAKLWMPFGVKSGVAHHLQCSALVGNPNEVGAYLGAAALAAIAALSVRDSKWAMGAGALVLVAGLLASQTLTAAGALTAAAFAMFARSSPKQALRTIAAGIVLVVLVFTLYTPFRTRVANMASWAKQGNYNTLLTDRLTPFTTAAMMFADRPVTGTGPGTFAWHYYDYKLRAEARYPLLREAWNRGVNYGEVHNDHLQVLAEGGILGYAAFVALLAALATISSTAPGSDGDARRRFAWRLAMPLAIYWIVLSLAQFPLETPVVRALLVHLAALCVAWRSS